MKRREKNLKKQTDASRSNGAIERLGDLRCFSNNNKQLDADGDDNDDDDGDGGAMDCTTVHCTDNTEDKKLIGLNRLDDPRPIQL